MSAKGRPEREYRSAQRGGTPMSAKGRPERGLSNEPQRAARRFADERDEPPRSRTP